MILQGKAIILAMLAVMCLSFGCAPETTIHADSVIQKQLDAKIAHGDLEEMTFEQVFEFIGETSGVNIQVKWRALAAEGVKPTDTMTLYSSNTTVRGLIGYVLNNISAGKAKLGYVINEDVLTISSRSDLGELAIIRVYDIRDIIEQTLRDASDPPIRGRVTDDAGLFDPGSGGGETDSDLPDETKIITGRIAEIKTLIRNKVDCDSWRVEGERNNAKQSGAISDINGQLVITQTAENHEKIVELIGEIREAQEAEGLKQAKDDGQVTRLIEQTKSQEREREFASAIKTLKQILVLDPHNSWAHERLELFQNMQFLRDQRELGDNRDVPRIYTGSIRRIPKNMAPDYPKDWKEVTDRRDTARAVGPPETKKPAEDRAIGAPSESEQE